jgi:hypothetical protein
MSIDIAPALTRDEWRDRRHGAISLDAVLHDEYVVIEEFDGTRATVSGPDELFALIALAFDALPDGDPRKPTRRWVQELRLAANLASLDYVTLPADAPQRQQADRSRDMLELIARVLERLLPPED